LYSALAVAFYLNLRDARRSKSLAAQNQTLKDEAKTQQQGAERRERIARDNHKQEIEELKATYQHQHQDLLEKHNAALRALRQAEGQMETANATLDRYKSAVPTILLIAEAEELVRELNSMFSVAKSQNNQVFLSMLETPLDQVSCEGQSYWYPLAGWQCAYSRHREKAKPWESELGKIMVPNPIKREELLETLRLHLSKLNEYRRKISLGS
jgi:hypothetical protein